MTRIIFSGEGSWSCQLCTFRNHPLLSVCEECEMPRISLGTQVMDVASHLSNVLSNNNTPFCMVICFLLVVFFILFYKCYNESLLMTVFGYYLQIT